MRSIPAKLFFTLALLTFAAESQTPNQWASHGNLIIGRAQHTATLLNDGRVLFVGGDCAPPPQSQCGGTAEIYDPATKRFSRTGSMVVGRFNHAATLLTDGRVLITGGLSGTRAPTTVEVYDPQTGQFSNNGSLKFDRPYVFAASLDDGRVVVAGSNPVEIYNPADGSSTLVEIGPAEGVRPIVLPNHRILFAGGSANSPSIYDLRSSTLRRLEFPYTGRSIYTVYDAVAQLTDGSILVTGGTPDGGWNSATNGATLYRPDGEDFVTPLLMPNMLDYRNAHTATALPDGSVLLFGGNAGGDMTSSVEIFHPGTLRYDQIPIQPDRASHTATLLLDGTVLIAGGSIQTDYTGLRRNTLGTVDLFIPVARIPPPAIYTVPASGSQGAIIHTGTSTLASPDNPAEAGEILEIYLTGLAPNGKLLPQVSIGGAGAEVVYFGAAAGYTDLFQINVRVPNSAARGPAVPVRLRYLDRPSNEVTIAIR